MNPVSGTAQACLILGLDFKDIAMLVAVIISPIVALLISIFIQNRTEKRKDRFSIFNTLMSTRYRKNPGEDVIKALNLIDVVFHDQKSVRGSLKEYKKMVLAEGTETEGQIQQRQIQYQKLIHEISKSLGYSKEIETWDINNVCIPKFYLDQERNSSETQTKIGNMLNLVNFILQSETNKKIPSPPPTESLLPTAKVDIG
jgi:hypothetical protein